MLKAFCSKTVIDKQLLLNYQIIVYFACFMQIMQKIAKRACNKLLQI